MRVEIKYWDNLRDRSERTWHALLLATADKAFTEPKDRIFALLGALTHGTIPPDYTMHLRVIYTSSDVQCIVTQGAFDILFNS
jgi:hypothetical protein